MNIVLLVLCVAFLTAYLIWFFFGQEKWSKLPNLIVDIVLIIACIGAFTAVYFIKGKEALSAGRENPVTEESTVPEEKENPAVPETEIRTVTPPDLQMQKQTN